MPTLYDSMNMCENFQPFTVKCFEIEADYLHDKM